MTFPLTPGIPFTEMGSMIDGVAVSACIASGMIVIVEVDLCGRVAGIQGAFCLRSQAWDAWQLVEMDDDFAIIIPGEPGARMYYGPITAAQFDAACGE